jgi:hypothetical protein
MYRDGSCKQASKYSPQYLHYLAGWVKDSGVVAKI